MLSDSKAFSGLSVNDLKAAKAFYGGMLGLNPVIAWFKDPAGNILSVLEES